MAQIFYLDDIAFICENCGRFELYKRRYIVTVSFEDKVLNLPVCRTCYNEILD